MYVKKLQCQEDERTKRPAQTRKHTGKQLLKLMLGEYELS